MYTCVQVYSVHVCRLRCTRCAGVQCSVEAVHCIDIDRFMFSSRVTVLGEGQVMECREIDHNWFYFASGGEWGDILPMYQTIATA